jgi:hypothetical protein
MRIVVLLSLMLLVLTGCVTAPPSNPSNLCSIFREKHDWYTDAKQAHKRWGAPIPVQMAILYQESRYVGDAKPPRKYLLWVIPWGRVSSAYGYSQALDSTWAHYKAETGHSSASRSDFGDATDFVGWYINSSHGTLGLAKSDAYSQYLVYYSGAGGYRRRTYRNKPWLRRTARRVASRARRYRRQLAGCRSELENMGHGWWPF